MSFSPSLWNAAPPPPARTREEARRQIEALAETARGTPTEFGDIARRWSEDAATASLGGSLGGNHLDRFFLWPNVLDALEETPVGGISRVVETPYGFHLLQRLPAPPEEAVSGERIVIAYDEAPWLAQYLARGPVPSRSRREAAALAQSVYAAAARAPGEFHRLVENHSEHRDAARDGDFGSWSTREPSPFPREVEVLRHLRIGEISTPIDSLYGFQIIKRTPERSRQRYAATWVRLSYGDERTVPEARSRASALQLSSDLLAQLQSGSVSLPDLGKHYPFKRAVSWWEGREAPALEAAIAQLAFGETVPRPVESGGSLFIVKRLPPDAPGSQP